MSALRFLPISPLHGSLRLWDEGGGMYPKIASTAQGRGIGLFGKLFTSLVFGMFLVIGSVLLVVTFKGFGRAWSMQGWPSVPCEITASEVVRYEEQDSDIRYRVLIRFRYTWQGNERETTWGGENGQTKNHIAEANELVARYSAGSAYTCRVNPADPDIAVLETDSLASGFAILFAAIFPTIGLAGLIWTWWPRRARAVADQPVKALSGNPAREARQGRKVGLFVALLFGGIGLIGTWFLLVKPGWKMIEARSWPSVPCIVEASSVERHSGSKGGSTYSIRILYRYEFQGRGYESDEYGFMGGSSSGYEGKAEVVNRHPPGSRTSCFVNPKNPAEAVLDRGPQLVMLFGLIPGVFLLVGAGFFIGTIRSGRKPDKISGSIRTSQTAAPPNAETVELRPQWSPWIKIFGALFVCLFWNGIVGVFVGLFINGWRKGRPEWFLGVFMIPFVLIGLVLVGYVLKSIMALFNPRPRLQLTPGTPVLGGRVRLGWSFSGTVSRLQSLNIEIEGRESATYKRGTSTSTDHSVFVRVPVLDTTDRTAIRSGQGEITLPPALAPSFAARNNKIEWFLRLNGKIAWWPDVDDEFPLRVLPSALTVTDESAFAPTAAEPVSVGGLKLGFRGGRRAFRPGEVIEGVAAWTLANAPKDAEVRLFWFTRGKGTGDLQVVETQRFDAPQMQEARPFRFQLPTEPISFDGTLISLTWAVELVVNPGEMAARLEFILSPDGQPARLSALPKESVFGKKWGFGRSR